MDEQNDRWTEMRTLKPHLAEAGATEKVINRVSCCSGCDKNLLTHRQTRIINVYNMAVRMVVNAYM